jgi:hypothetical protein
MKNIGIFLAGFASGWVVRSTVDSSRGLAVSGVSTVFGTISRVRRILAIEKEHLEDLVAEGKAKHDARLGRVVGSTNAVASVPTDGDARVASVAGHRVRAA